jgi:hypothetical protein
MNNTNSTNISDTLAEFAPIDLVSIGIGCTVGSDFAFSLSFVLQKLAHNGNKEKVSYTRLPFWWLGILFLILGEVGEFIAYGLAPVSLISPLGTMAGLQEIFDFS